jgi:hypothetical protein
LFSRVDVETSETGETNNIKFYLLACIAFQRNDLLLRLKYNERDKIIMQESILKDSHGDFLIGAIIIHKMITSGMSIEFICNKYSLNFESAKGSFEQFLKLCKALKVKELVAGDNLLDKKKLIQIIINSGILNVAHQIPESSRLVYDCRPDFPNLISFLTNLPDVEIIIKILKFIPYNITFHKGYIPWTQTQNIKFSSQIYFSRFFIDKNNRKNMFGIINPSVDF